MVGNLRGQLQAGVLLGIVGLPLGGTLFAIADYDRHVYVADASCTAGFVNVGRTNGSCRIESAYVLQWYYGGRRGTTPHLVLQNGNGRFDAEFRRNVRGDVFHRVLFPGGRDATMQLFHGRVVRIETRYGTIATSSDPTERVNLWAFLAIASAAIGIASALWLLALGTSRRVA